MSEFPTTVATIIITAITSGGLVGSLVAFKKDKRDALQSDLNYTKEFRDIAKEEVRETREELDKMGKKVKILEDKVSELESSVRLKDRIIVLLVDYIGRLRDVLDKLKPKHPLPEVPDELKEYLK